MVKSAIGTQTNELFKGKKAVEKDGMWLMDDRMVFHRSQGHVVLFLTD